MTLEEAAALADRREPWVRRAAWTVFALAVLAFVVRGADRPADPYVDTSAAGGSPAAPVRTPVEGFGSVLFRITSASGSFADFCALLAADPDARAQGLMERTDLAGHDGMVFRFEEPIDARFYMYRTRLPLSIAWFDDAGSFVSATQMEPCPSEDPGACPRYAAERPYLHALEVPKGRLGIMGVGPGSSISFPDGPEAPCR